MALSIDFADKKTAKLRITRQHASLSRLAKPLMAMLMIFYIGYHVLHGERGLFALMREKRELSSLQSDYIALKAEREKMELRVSHLRDNSLDRDLLDEQMRRMLGVMKKDEVMILTN